MERMKVRDTSRPILKNKVTNLSNKKRCKPKNNLRLLSWERKYQHTLLNFVNPELPLTERCFNKTSEESRINSNFDDTLQNCANYKAGEVCRIVPNKFDVTSAVSNTDKENFYPNLTEASIKTDGLSMEDDLSITECNYKSLKDASKIRYKKHVGKYSELDSLFAFPFRLKRKFLKIVPASSDRSNYALDPIPLGGIKPKLNTRFKNAFERGSLCYKASDLIKLFS